MLLALADDTFVLAIHGEIASEFHELSMGPWLVSAYNMGYFASLPMVRKALWTKPCLL